MARHEDSLEEIIESLDVAFDKNDYADLLAQDTRYDSRAYDFVLSLFAFVTQDKSVDISFVMIFDLFRDVMLGKYGPMAYAVLSDWGVHSCKDLNEIIARLMRTKRIASNEAFLQTEGLSDFDFRDIFRDAFCDL